MGKGTKKKTVWRTFSFENGYTNGNDVAVTDTATVAAAHTTNGFTVLHQHNHHQHQKQKIENGNNDITNKSSITNGKFINNWRIQRCTADDNEADENGDGDAIDGNDTESKLHHHTNGNGLNGYQMENGGRRSYFKRSSHSENNHNNTKYPLRMNGLRKSSAYFQENGGGGGGGGVSGGTRSDIHDIYENSIQHSQYRSNRSSKGPPTSRFANYRKWDSRNGSFNLNGSAVNNYSRGFRKSHFIHSDEATTASSSATTEAATAMTTATAPQQQQPIATEVTTSNEFINHTDEHFHEAKNARNADDSDKCHDNTNNGDGNSSQQLYDQTDKRRGKQQQNKFNEDEYTRISTPRSEVLFKKGYLMRDRKYVGPTNTISMAAAAAAATTTTSSNDSGSVSVISNEETASYYSIQSMSPDDSNSTYMNGGGGHSSSTDSSHSATYPNDGFEHDLSLIYSSGFYDNNGYFYVNPYIHNNFDQFNGPAILMPYGSAPTTTTTPTTTITKDIDAYDADAYPQSSLSPGTGDGKSVDSEQANNFSSINSEEMSNSSLSINNDSDTPPNPLTPPPSPLSPNEEPITRAPLTETENSEESHENDVKPENDDDDSQTNTAAAPDGENVNEPIADVEQGEVPDTDAIVSTDNYSMPYFSPLIFVPPIPFVPDARLANSRRGKFRRHLNNQYGRMRRNNRFSHFYNKVYIPSNWSEAPDEAASSNTNTDNTIESNDEKSADGTPTIEQCDKILKNSKLNLNVSEFIPQNKRMIFVPLSIASSPPASLYFVPIPSTESTLNVNVPEFLPKNYKPLNERNEENEPCPSISTINGKNDDKNNEDGDEDENEDDNNNSNKNYRNREAKSSSTTHNGGDDDDATILTNESAKNQNNETTINHKNDLNKDATKEIEYTTPNGTPSKPITTAAAAAKTTMTTAAAIVAAAPTAIPNGIQDSHTIAIRKTNLPNKPNGVSVPTMSDLLKTKNSDNLNLNAAATAACNFNKENNSHTNLKADLGNKKITYNNSKKVYKNDNQFSDSGSNKNHNKLNNSNNNNSNNNTNTNRNAKTRHAYPRTKETSHKQHQQDEKSQPEQQQQQRQQQKTMENEVVEKVDQPVSSDVSDQKMLENEPKSVEKSSRTYAQMVVPMITKITSNTATTTTTLMKIIPKSTDNKMQVNGTLKTSKSPSKSSTPSSSLSLSSTSSPKDKNTSSNINRNKNNYPSKKRNSNNYNNNNISKGDTKRKPDILEKPLIEGSIEWFTVDSKGKKHAAPNGSPVTEIAFENIESNEEKVNKIAEELLLDINKDADLAMDIMDSLTVNTEEKSGNETKVKVAKKKKSTTTTTATTNKIKKKSKDKLNKEQREKRRDTFDIIEPNFGTKKPAELKLSNEVDVHIEGIENDDHQVETTSNELNQSLDIDNEYGAAAGDNDDHNDDNDNDGIDKELIFDPNVFATPCNLQMDSHQMSPSIVGPALSKSLRLSNGGKTVRNLINQFDIYQPDFTSYESQQLKQEEEMVIKVLQQLNNNNNNINVNIKSVDGVEIMESDKLMVHDKAEVEVHATYNDEIPTSNDIVTNELCDELISMREDSVERFAINAKPYQNVYSSNHFLEHFFGDRNDKRDHVVDSEPSTDLSSSDQPECVDEINEDGTAIVVENFNTYPTIRTDDNDECSGLNENIQCGVQNGDSIENECVEDKSEQPDQLEEVGQTINSETEQIPVIETNEKIEIETETKIEVEHQQQSIECKADQDNIELEIEHPIIENVCKSMQEIHTELNSDNESIQKPQTETQIEAFPVENNCTENETNEINNEIAESICTEPNDMTKIEKSSIEPIEQCVIEPCAVISCNQSVKSNTSNNGRPWLRIVDTQTLEQEKKVQQTFPITSAVSMWLQAQKEKTPEPVLRIPNYRNFLTSAAASAAVAVSSSSSSSTAGTKRSKIDSQTSHSNSSVDLTEDTASITSDKFQINDDDDDEEEDIMNFWESPLLSPQSPTPPPIYQSVYGNSINYTNLLSNKNELLCNNIVDFDRIDATAVAAAAAAATNGKPNNTNMNGKMSATSTTKQINGLNQNAAAAAADTNGKIGNGTDENGYRPPHHEVCCTIM